MNEKITPLRILRSLLGLSLMVYIFTRGNIGSWLPYYTIQTNLMVAVWYILAGTFPKHKDKLTYWMKDSVKGAITTYITITGFVYILVLIPYEIAISGRISTTSIITHMIVPVIMIADYLLTGSKENPEWKQLPIWLTYPILYAVITLIRAAYTGFWPYPFINPSEVNSTFQLVFNYIALVGVHAGVAAVYLAIARKKWKKFNT